MDVRFYLVPRVEIRSPVRIATEKAHNGTVVTYPGCITPQLCNPGYQAALPVLIIEQVGDILPVQCFRACRIVTLEKRFLVAVLIGDDPGIEPADNPTTSCHSLTRRRA